MGHIYKWALCRYIWFISYRIHVEDVHLSQMLLARYFPKYLRWKTRLKMSTRIDSKFYKED